MLEKSEDQICWLLLIIIIIGRVPQELPSQLIWFRHNTQAVHQIHQEPDWAKHWAKKVWSKPQAAIVGLHPILHDNPRFVDASIITKSSLQPNQYDRP